MFIKVANLSRDKCRLICQFATPFHFGVFIFILFRNGIQTQNLFLNSTEAQHDINRIFCIRSFFFISPTWNMNPVSYFFAISFCFCLFSHKITFLFIAFVCRNIYASSSSSDCCCCCCIALYSCLSYEFWHIYVDCSVC